MNSNQPNTAARLISQYILVTTEQEIREAGAFPCYYDLSIAKSRKHIEAHQKKMLAYYKLISNENKNFIEIHVLSRGKYRYQVSADCSRGFRANTESRFTGLASARVKEFLQSIKHKTSCTFSSYGNYMVYGSVSTWDDAANFADFLCQLDLSNYRISE